MNREEATQWLEQIKNFLIYGGDEKFDERRKEALDMAIHVLEQEPCEDAISREKVIEICAKAPFVWISVGAAIQDLPSVQHTRKRGKWITTRTFQHDGEFYCNKCKCDSPKNEKWEFCPNCGADMREDGE